MGCSLPAAAAAAAFSRGSRPEPPQGGDLWLLRLGQSHGSGTGAPRAFPSSHPE